MDGPQAAHTAGILWLAAIKPNDQADIPLRFYHLFTDFPPNKDRNKWKIKTGNKLFEQSGNGYSILPWQ
jgi:hypothetical protein